MAEIQRGGETVGGLTSQLGKYVLPQRFSERVENVVGGRPSTLRLLLYVVFTVCLMKLSSELLASSLAERMLDKLAGITAGRSSKAFGLHARFAFGGDRDLDCLVQVAPPLTLIVTLIEPSGSVASVN